MYPCNVSLVVVAIAVLGEGVVLRVVKNGLVRELWQRVVRTKGQSPDRAQYHKCVGVIVLALASCPVSLAVVVLC